MRDSLQKFPIKEVIYKLLDKYNKNDYDWCDLLERENGKPQFSDNYYGDHFMMK